MLRKVILAISILTLCVVITSIAQATTTVTTSENSVNYTENDDMFIDPGIRVNSNATFESATVFIEKYVKGEDKLLFTDTNGIEGSFDSSKGLLTLRGTGDAVAYQTALRNVRYMNTNDKPTACCRDIVYELGNSTLYFPETQHYYENVHSSSPIGWTAAKSAAENRTYDDLQGYLATIDSDEENKFIGTKVNANAWIGASDKAVEGKWKWVTGPEAGTLFYCGNYPGNSIGYNNWMPGKPDDFRDGKDLGEDYACIDGNDSGKTWNDDPDENYVQYYIVEYGGMPGETLPQFEATIKVNIISVNDLPSIPDAFTSPVEGQVVQGGKTMTVNWGPSTDADGDLIKYNLWFFNGSWTQIGKSLNNRSIDFTFPRDNTDNAMFRVHANDTIGNSSAQGVTFAIDSSGPAYRWIQKILQGVSGENVTVIVNLKDISDIIVHNITVNGQHYEMKEDSGNYYRDISIPGSETGNVPDSITYNCTFIDQFGHVNSTGEISINVSILPYADFDVNSAFGTDPFTVYFTDGSYYADSWKWDFGDGSTSDEQNPTHVFNSGNFTVSLTVSNLNGSSSKTMNINVLKTPDYTIHPDTGEKISLYGEEINFSISSSMLSSFEWYIDGSAINGPGVTLYANNNDSDKLSYCLINTSRYINQSDFFVQTYNMSVDITNQSTGTKKTFVWDWTVTDSSAENSEDICFVIVREANLTINNDQTIVDFNTRDETKKDNNNIAGSLIGVSFDTSDNASDLLLKFEVIKKSSLNESETGFSTDSVYQHMDIRVNNKALVNDSANRTIEFRVLNELDGDILNTTFIQLKHRDGIEWETYNPEFLNDDGTYSYYSVNNISGFSPFTIIANYGQTGHSTTDDMPAYLKEELLKKAGEKNVPQYEDTKRGLEVPLIKGELSSGQENNGTFTAPLDNSSITFKTKIGKMVLTAAIMLIAVWISMLFLIRKTKE